MIPITNTTARKPSKGKSKKAVRQQPDITRVAIYTRKSVETGADETFTSLDAQRSAVESYVVSQAEKGWMVLKKHYDDNGYTGGNLKRPGFKELMADIEAGTVDVVAVYRLDRLSRRQIDFLQLLERFEERGVEFCSVTEQFSTGTPTGRLILSIVGTFAQFEREVNSERTSHKILESRRKGLWTGGSPILGFDVVKKRLVVNEPEAIQVREVFRIYIEKQSLRLACLELAERGIHLKRWITEGGKTRGGKPFNTNTLSRIIQNPLCIGMIWAGEEMVEASHPAILEREVWLRANEVLEQNRRREGPSFANRHRYLLRGLLKCGRCGSTMAFVISGAKNAKRYSSYLCQRAFKEGAWACPQARAPMRVIEGPVVEQLLASEGAFLASAWKRGVEQANLGRKDTRSNPTPADLADLEISPPIVRRASWVRLDQKERVEVLRAAVSKVIFDPETGEVVIHRIGDDLVP